MIQAKQISTNGESLLLRAESLGKNIQDQLTEETKIIKGPKIDQINETEFVQAMNNTQPPDLDLANSIDTALLDITQTINSVAKSNRTRRANNQTYINKWTHYLETRDDKAIWRDINWKGQFNNHNDDHKPTDDQFKEYFGNLLTADNQFSPLNVDISSAAYIPQLDDPFSPDELYSATQKLKSGKSFIGVCPGLLKLLPINWMVSLLMVLNVIFCNAYCPAAWCTNKLITIFKGGNPLSCCNYRGISIMETCAKLFDVLINERLKRWARPSKEQAGAQEKRGCIEQIMTLRLLVDFAVFKKCKLFLCFVDFSKAYDKVPRQKLIQRLLQMGCGYRCLAAIIAMYKCTKNMLRTAILISTIGFVKVHPLVVCYSSFTLTN